MKLLAAVVGGAAVASPTKSLADGKVGSLIQMKVQHEANNSVRDLGTITIGLFNEEVPKTSENFEWVCSEHLVDTVFHRVIPQFMAQGGDFTKGNGTGGMS